MVGKAGTRKEDPVFFCIFNMPCSKHKISDYLAGKPALLLKVKTETREMDRWMDGWMDRQTDRFIIIFTKLWGHGKVAKASKFFTF